MRTNLLYSALAIGTVFSFIAPQMAYAGDKTGDFDLFLTTHRWQSVTSNGLGKSARVSSVTMVGPAMGFRIHNNININVEFLFGEPDASVTPGPNKRADAKWFNLGLDYYIKRVDACGGSVEPFITGGVGALGLKQDAVGGFDEWPFTYNFGLGLRWNMSGSTFMRFQYRWLWSELDVTGKTELFDGFGFVFGFSI